MKCLKCNLSSKLFEIRSIKDLEPFVKAMYRKLEPFILVLTYQVLSSSEIAFTGPIFMI